MYKRLICLFFLGVLFVNDIPGQAKLYKNIFPRDLVNSPDVTPDEHYLGSLVLKNVSKNRFLSSDELTNDESYLYAGGFSRVAIAKNSISIPGLNSTEEDFLSVPISSDYVSDFEGDEFYKSNYVLKLTSNLFTASELNRKEKRIKINHEANFPYTESTTLIVTTRFKLMVRSPSWVGAGALKVIVIGDPLLLPTTSGTNVSVQPPWKKDNFVNTIIPMQNTDEQLPNIPNYFVTMHEPMISAIYNVTFNFDKFVSEHQIRNLYQSQLQDIEYVVPNSMIMGKENIYLKFQAAPESFYES